MLLGLIGGPLIGMMFVSYESNSYDWSGIKAMLVANAKLAFVLATIGVIIGFMVGIVKVLKGEHEVDL
jgi:hypothetical protein